MKDRNWLVRLTNAVNQHWHNKNARRKGRPSNGSTNGLPAELNLSAPLVG